MSATPAGRPPQRIVQTGFATWSEAADAEGTMPPLPKGEIGLLITGVARGGTSWAASVCHHLGINLGRRGPRYENQRLAKALLNEDMELLKKRLDGEWDRQQSWAWKLPALNYHLDAVAAMLERARFIFVIRDPVAVAMRKQKSEQTMGDPLRDARRVSDAFDRFCDFTQRSQKPCLFLSYEKALAFPRGAVEDIARFVGQSVSAEAVSQIVEAVAEDQNAYGGARATSAA